MQLMRALASECFSTNSCVVAAFTSDTAYACAFPASGASPLLHWRFMLSVFGTISNAVLVSFQCGGEDMPAHAKVFSMCAHRHVFLLQNCSRASTSKAQLSLVGIPAIHMERSSLAKSFHKLGACHASSSKEICLDIICKLKASKPGWKL